MLVILGRTGTGSLRPIIPRAALISVVVPHELSARRLAGRTNCMHDSSIGGELQIFQSLRQRRVFLGRQPSSLSLCFLLVTPYFC
jgi:hypothetical protein